MSALIAYFSRKGENYVNGAIRNLTVGNTQIAAEMLQELTKAEIFAIEPVCPYAQSYNTCIAQAEADQRRNARPELKAYPANLETYDRIYLGYPNYWGTMPMAVFTFLEHFDFTGKEICPFCTHEGSGMGDSEADIRRLCPGAQVKKGLAIHGGSASRGSDAMRKWLEELNGAC